MKPIAERPRVLPPVRRTDVVLEIAAVGVLLGTAAYAIVSYATLPEQIPVHFDLSGKPDREGSRATIFGIVGVAAVLYVILSAVGRLKPWYWNIPAVVTEANAVGIYGAMARMLRVLKLCVGMLMGSILWLMVDSARTGRAEHTWVIASFVAMVLGNVAWGIVEVRRRAKLGAPSGGIQGS